MSIRSPSSRADSRRLTGASRFASSTRLASRATRPDMPRSLGPSTAGRKRCSIPQPVAASARRGAIEGLVNAPLADLPRDERAGRAARRGRRLPHGRGARHGAGLNYWRGRGGQQSRRGSAVFDTAITRMAIRQGAAEGNPPWRYVSVTDDSFRERGENTAELAGPERVDSRGDVGHGGAKSVFPGIRAQPPVVGERIWNGWRHDRRWRARER